MKTKLLLGSLLAFSGIANAQWTTSGSNVYKSTLPGFVGIGTAAPGYKLDINTNGSGFDDGIRISNNANNSSPSIYFNNTYGPPSKLWALQAQYNSTGTRMVFNNLTDGLTPFGIEANGQVWIGPTGMGGPNGQFHVATNNSTSMAIRGDHSATNPIALAGYAAGSGGTGTIARGCLGWGYGADQNHGGNFNATGGSQAKGVFGTANNSSDNRGGDFTAPSGGRGVMGTATGGGQNMGGWFEANDNGTGGMSIGSDNYATGNGITVAVRGNVYGGTATSATHFGGVFQSWSTTSGRNVGASGTAAGGSVYNIGLVGSANAVNALSQPLGFTSPYPSGANIGVYGTACLTGAYASPSSSWAGWFDNDVNINGFAYCNSSAWSSDRKFKKEIKTIENANAIIGQLNPTTYFFNTENEYGMNFSNKKQFGFISQEVEVVLPDLIQDVHKPAGINQDGKEITKAVDYKALNYIGFIALLTKGAQEQQAVIDELKAANATQQQQIDALLRKTNTTTGIDQLNPGFEFVMNQNEPNPFSHETVIKYTLPQQVNTASLLVYDLTGKQLASFPITEKGSAAMTITSEKLSAGIYIYSIVADGKVMDSKRMIVAEK